MIKPVQIKQLNISALLHGLDDPDKIRQIERAAVLAGARSLYSSLRESVRANVPKSTVPNKKYKDVLLDAIRMSTENDDHTRIVHAYGTREPKSGTYRLRFFNKDTKDRYQKTFNGKKLKKRRFLGHISGTDFFDKGYNFGKSAAEMAMKNAVLNIVNNL